MARIQFLQREYAQALKTIEQVCLIDPEDLQAHYTAMLAHRGLGHEPVTVAGSMRSFVAVYIALPSCVDSSQPTLRSGGPTVNVEALQVETARVGHR